MITETEIAFDAINGCLPQLTAQAAAYHNVAVQAELVCLVIGFVIGILTGYYYCKRRFYGSGE